MRRQSLCYLCREPIEDAGSAVAYETARAGVVVAVHGRCAADEIDAGRAERVGPFRVNARQVSV